MRRTEEDKTVKKSKSGPIGKTSGALKRTHTREPPPRRNEPGELPATDAVVEVPIEDIQPDQHQPRARAFRPEVFRPEHVEHITSTIEVQKDGTAVPGRGIREPIRIRKAPPNAPLPAPWMILDGEGRYQGAKIKGLRIIPARIVEIDEAHVLEEQLLASIARRDLKPLDLADSLARLKKDRKKLNAEELALRVGLASARVVRRYLALAGLAPEVRAALGEDKLSMAAALELATIASHDDQVKALGEIERVEPRSVRSVIQSKYHLRLVGGPAVVGFDVEDTSLPGGPCEACPKNTARQRKLWVEAGKDDEARCTDRACFERKRAETWKRKKDAAAATGAKVVEGEEAKKIFPSPYSSRPADPDVIDLDEECEFDEGAAEEKRPARTWREVLGGEAKPSIMAQDQGGRAHELLTLRDAAEQLRAQGKTEMAAQIEQEAAEHAEDEGPELPERREDWRLEQKARRAAEEEALSFILAEVGRKDAITVWRFVAGLLAREEDDGLQAERLTEITELQREADARGFVLELLFARAGKIAEHKEHPFLLACRFVGVDFEALRSKHRELAGLEREEGARPSTGPRCNVAGKCPHHLMGAPAADDCGEAQPADVQPATVPQGRKVAAKDTCRICGCTAGKPCQDATGTPCSWMDWDERDLCSQCGLTIEAIVERVEDAEEGLDRDELLLALDITSLLGLDEHRIHGAIDDLLGLGTLEDRAGRLYAPGKAPKAPNPIEVKIRGLCRGRQRSRKQIVAGCKDFPAVEVQSAIDRLVAAERLATAGEGDKTKFITIIDEGL